jgi:hypothetical protein
MNKEEIDKWLNEEYGCSYTRLEELHDFYFEKYCDLRDRINKAIEYMKNNATSNYFDKEKNMFRREEDLLEILKGEN